MAFKEQFWDAYVHDATERALAEQGQTGTLCAPIFLRLTSECWAACAADLRQWLSQLATDPSTPRPASLGFLAAARVDPAELSLAVAVADAQGLLPEFFVYLEHGAALDGAQAEAIDFGPPLRIADGQVPPQPLSSGNASASAPGVVGAVIDTGLGFLNERFRDSSLNTRFGAVWLQSTRLTADPVSGVVSPMRLSADQIDQMIRGRHQSESELYAELNRSLSSSPEFQRTWPRATHGTAVTDIAFGAEGADDMPLMAVQIPVEAAQDTSGTLSEAYIVAGVRWLCAQARTQFPGHALVINISLGVLAGQKDGGRFIEEQIRRELDHAAALGQQVHTVFAYGNGHNTRQVAQLTLGAAAQTMEWVIQPDNAAASFLEIHGLDGQLTDLPAGVELTLTAPDGAQLCFTTAAQGGGLLRDTGQTGARLYDTPARSFADPNRPGHPRHICLMVPPTEHAAPATQRAMAGTWRLSLAKPQGAPLSVVLQIQRGDSAPGFPTDGRQSFFEGRFVPDPEIPGRETVAAPLTNAGCNSAYTTLSHPNSHAIAASQSRFGDVAPSVYSARGATWSGGGPEASQLVDQPFSMGVCASGTLSGTQTRLSGTSAAAALFSRELAAQIRAGQKAKNTAMV